MIRGVGVICVVLALAIVGCGGDSDSSTMFSYRPFSFPPGVGDRKGRSAEDFQELMKKNGLAGAEPKPAIPDGPPPEFVAILELIDGAATPYAEPGDEVTIQYVGARYDSKEKFASSWDEGKPLTFTLGSGELLDGLEEGLEKIELADRREIVIPAELATGGSRMKGVPENEALVFVVELLNIDQGR
jgi:peptidylprolyl isomerase